MNAKIPETKPTTINVHGVEIAYDAFGNPADPLLLLISGLASPRIDWYNGLCAQLAARGLYVARFDNRDVGRSARLDHLGTPELHAKEITAPYSLRDMAGDALAVLDALGAESAHVVGHSMGGMIAQTLAIHHGERVRTLTSIGSSTGHPGLPGPEREVWRRMSGPIPSEREAFVEHSLAMWTLMCGPAYPLLEEPARRHAEAVFEHRPSSTGRDRQLAAIRVDGSRRVALGGLAMPVLVIHGDADPVIPIECGRDTAAAVPDAELLVIEGLGHDLHLHVWPRLVDAIARHVQG